jgi:hypothetical protein
MEYAERTAVSIRIKHRKEDQRGLADTKGERQREREREREKKIKLN